MVLFFIVSLRVHGGEEKGTRGFDLSRVNFICSNFKVRSKLLVVIVYIKQIARTLTEIHF